MVQTVRSHFKLVLVAVVAACAAIVLGVTEDPTVLRYFTVFLSGLVMTGASLRLKAIWTMVTTEIRLVYLTLVMFASTAFFATLETITNGIATGARTYVLFVAMLWATVLFALPNRYRQWVPDKREKFKHDNTGV